ncbi:MAG: ABC transporter ATP-binding protein [Candidatus Paceibacterota bacterium]
MLRAENIKKEYHTDSVVTPVLKGVNFKIEDGEFVSIVGVSGSGKSTLLNVIGLLDNPTSGQYWIDNKKTADLNSEERAELRSEKIGFVFQRYNLLPRTSVLENVLLPTIYNAKINRQEAEQRAHNLLEKVGLSHRLQNEPNELSGGESQRVAIARSLINDPSLILADEPTGNLGYKHTEPVMDIFDDLNREGHTILLVTHSKEIANYASRMLHLEKGIIRERPPREMNHTLNGSKK